MSKVLALTTDGKLTWCTATDENIGKGRCNHVAHQKIGEPNNDFINRMQGEFNKNKKIVEYLSLSKKKTIRMRSKRRGNRRA